MTEVHTSAACFHADTPAIHLCLYYKASGAFRQTSFWGVVYIARKSRITSSAAGCASNENTRS